MSRTGAPYLIGWGLWLGLLATVLWIWTPDPLPPALLGAAALGSVLLGVVALLQGWTERSRHLPDSSLPTVLVAFGAAMTLNGVAFGIWLVLIGGEVFILGLALLLREHLLARRRRS